MMTIRKILLSHEPLDTSALRDVVSDDKAGAIVVFEGVTRDVAMLRFEAYEEMAIKQIQQHVENATRKFSITGIAVAHRLGDVPLGEASIVICVSAGHRPESFDACRYVLDAIKADVPIWKQEITGDGTATWGKSEMKLQT